MGDITDLRNKYGPKEMSSEELIQNTLSIYEKLYQNELKLSDMEVESTDNVSFHVHSYLLYSQRFFIFYFIFCFLFYFIIFLFIF